MFDVNANLQFFVLLKGSVILCFIFELLVYVLLFRKLWIGILAFQVFVCFDI